MALISRVAGSKLYIGSSVPYKSVVTAADFTDQVWTEIGGWATTGDLGSEQETVSQTLISQNSTIYAKGTISFPIMANVVTPIKDDPGQIAFAAAQRSCKPYAFRITWSADCGEEGVVTISVASPGVITWNAHGLVAGAPISFATTGALPTGLTAGQTYYVVSPTSNAFSVATTPGGTAIVTTGTQSGIHTASAPEIGDSDYFFAYAMDGTVTGGDSSALRLKNIPLQPISRSITI